MLGYKLSIDKQRLKDHLFSLFEQIKNLITNDLQISSIFLTPFCFNKDRQKINHCDIWSLYYLDLMHFKSETIKNPSSKQILLPKRQKNKSIMPVTIKSLLLCQKTEQIIHSQRHLRQKLKANPNPNPNTNPKPSNRSHSMPQLLFQNFSKLKNNNLCQFLHSQKASAPIFKRCKTQIKTLPKSDGIIFKAQIGCFVKKIQKKHSYCDGPIKWSRQSPFNLANLRRSFKISSHYKSSLMDLNIKNRYPKLQTISHSISNNSFSIKLERPAKRKNSLIIALRKKSKVEKGSGRKDEIRGWEDTQVRYKSLQFSDLY